MQSHGIDYSPCCKGEDEDEDEDAYTGARRIKISVKRIQEENMKKIVQNLGDYTQKR